jgi:hypothetical protein
MSVIERVKVDERITDWIDLHSVGEFVWIDELLDFFSSLAEERCVWDKIHDPDFENAYYYETDCGNLIDDSLAQEWFRTPDESKWNLCKCGLPIEIKEESNG